MSEQSRNLVSIYMRKNFKTEKVSISISSASSLSVVIRDKFDSRSWPMLLLVQVFNRLSVEKLRSAWQLVTGIAK